MNIAFFGSSLLSSYWNGACTYYRGLLKALAALGHDITFYEPDAYDRQAHRDMPEPDWARVIVYPATTAAWQSALEAAARGADLLVKASGVGVFDSDIEQALPDAARAGTVCAFWDVDAPATLDAIGADPAHHLPRILPRYDIVFTYGGGDPVRRGYEAVGARRCRPIYNALDPESHHPVPPRPDYAGELGFLGNRLPDREARVERFFLDAAARLPHRAFLIGGSGWHDKPMPPNVRRVGHVGTGDHNAFFCSTLATLNINRDSMARYGYSPPTRVFEAAGTGACLITDAWIGIDQFLEPGREVLVASSGEGVGAYVSALTPASARIIGEAARRRVLAHHTYGHRAREVQQILDGMSLKGEAAE